MVAPLKVTVLPVAGIHLYIKAQTERVMKNLEAVLKEAGMSFANVIKTTVFLSDMKTFADMNSVYAEYFPTNPPARSTVQVAKLPKDAGIRARVCAISLGASVIRSDTIYNRYSYTTYNL